MTGSWECARCGRTDVTAGHGVTATDPCPLDTVDCDRAKVCADPGRRAEAAGLRVAALGEDPGTAELGVLCAACPHRPPVEPGS